MRACVCVCMFKCCGSLKRHQNFCSTQNLDNGLWKPCFTVLMEGLSIGKGILPGILVFARQHSPDRLSYPRGYLPNDTAIIFRWAAVGYRSKVCVCVCSKYISKKVSLGGYYEIVVKHVKIWCTNIGQLQHSKYIKQHFSMLANK